MEIALKIITVAIKKLQQYGAKAVNIDDISKKVGISKKHSTNILKPKKCCCRLF